ncbi:MAG: phosphodiester glycosidase family protein [Lentisphaerae bacterium]|nr:phosphodiester glycosidase family protein [Lentisphaerota bacterium]
MIPRTIWAAVHRCSLLAFILSLMVSEAVFAEPSSIVHQKRKIAGFWAQVITININDPDVRIAPAVARRGVGYSETFQSFLDRTRPTAAITGTFFDTRSLFPVGDIVVEGNHVHRGVVGTALGIGWNNEITFTPTKRGKVSDWSGYRHVIAAGPQLLCGGTNAVAPWNEGFRDSGIYSKAPRAAIGLTRNNKVLLVTVKQSLHLTQLAGVMKGLGCVNAAVLDGGSSTAMYFRGNILHNPQRRLTNILVAYDKSSLYEQSLSHLAPGIREVVAERQIETTDSIVIAL